jgi:hypothetical protein
MMTCKGAPLVSWHHQLLVCLSHCYQLVVEIVGLWIVGVLCLFLAWKDFSTRQDVQGSHHKYMRLLVMH